MERITASTTQIIINSSESARLSKEIERLFIRFGNNSGFSISAMEKKFPAVIELYRLVGPRL